MGTKKVIQIIAWSLVATIGLAGAAIFLFTEPIPEDAEVRQCEYGFDAASNDCYGEPDPDCYTYYWTDENGTEHEGEDCVAAAYDGGTSTYYTTDGNDPEFQIPGTNVAYPLSPWMAHTLAGAVLLKTGNGVFGIIGKIKAARARKRSRPIPRGPYD